MWGRLLGILAGLALCGEAIILWRPQAIGALSAPDLGPFSSYRMIIAALAGAVGIVVIIAALLRDAAPAKAKPLGADWAPKEAAAVEAVPIFHAAPDPQPAAVTVSAVQEAHEPAAVEPFPAAEAVHASPQPAAQPEPEAPAAPAAPPLPAPAAVASGERGTFLAAVDAGDQMRAANRLDDALELYDGALALARRAHAGAPSDAVAQRDLALALTNVADIYDRDGRLESALALHEESLGLRRAVAGRSPDDVAAQRALSLGLERLADTREARGHRSRARDLYRERLPLAERLAAMAPGDAGLAQDLATTRERLGELDAALAT
jgi:tetratricopeptide (TPR) repeat protein